MNQTMIGKPPTSGRYYCSECFAIFELINDSLKCPSCLNSDRDVFVLVYVRDIAEEELMHTGVDFQGG